MQTEQINHDPAHTFMNTGTTISGRPSMGSWLSYGLGSEADDLPGFVVLTSHGPVRPDAADRRAAVAQRLPAQPVPGRRSSARKGDPVLYVSNPPGVDARRSSATSIDAVDDAQPHRRPTRCDDPEIATRIAQYEMAFRCRPACPS